MKEKKSLIIDHPVIFLFSRLLIWVMCYRFKKYVYHFLIKSF